MNALRVTIAEPCHKDWSTMLPDGQGRFCNSCSKTVIDFTVMNNREMQHAITNGPVNACGRFTNQQLAGVLPTETNKKQRWHKYFFSVVVPAFLFARQVTAQKVMGKIAAKPICASITMGTIAHTPSKKHFEFSGILTDAATKELIGNASIKILETDGGTQTDTLGHFKLKGNTSLQTITLLISATGFETRQFEVVIPVDNFIVANEHIVLERKIRLLKEVVLQTPVDITSGNFKSYVVINKYSIAYNSKRLSTALKDAIKIFPDPVKRGSSFMATLKLKKAGNYTIQIMDETGRLVWQQQINAVAAVYEQPITMTDARSGGIYFLSVVTQGNELISTSRFLVQ